MRLWHQARTEIDRLPSYRDAMATHFRRVGEPGTTVDLHGMSPDTYISSSGAVGDNKYSYFSSVHDIQVLNNVRRAEKEGYDGFLICNLPERMKEEAQSLVDIPVVSSTQSSMYAAAMLGERFVLFTMNEELVPLYENQIKRYGMQTRSWGVAWLGIPQKFVMDGYENPESFIKLFEERTRELAQQGVDVVIPGEAPVCTLLSNINMRRVDEIPIVDTLGVTLKFAEFTLVRLSQLSGMRSSKAGFYSAKPPAARVEEVAQFYHLNEFGRPL